MEFSNLTALITLAFGLGIVHALDADHIMAVSALTSSQSKPRNSLKFCLRWAIGHGTTLIIIGSCVYLLGMAIPEQLSQYAENAVGLVLIIIGLFVLLNLYRKNLHLHSHQHEGFPVHVHWHAHEHSKNKLKNPEQHKRDPHRHNHSAVMVGVLHGAAGSAPLLVLVPLAKLTTPLYGIIYLLCFSVGVLICMAVFGGMIDKLYRWLAMRGSDTVKLLRLTIASSAIVFGGFLLAGV